jgi:hypothetical protein
MIFEGDEGTGTKEISDDDRVERSCCSFVA